MRKLLPLVLLLLALTASAADVPSTPAAQSKPAFLFATFRNDGQSGLYLLWSTDRLNWHPLWNDLPVLKSRTGDEKLVRDPYLTRTPDGTFHLVFTSAMSGNSIGYARSKDLVTWTDEAQLPVMKDIPDNRYVWAPGMYFDEAKKTFYIYWYSAPKTPANAKGKVYYTVTPDFKTFDKPQVLFSPDFTPTNPDILKKPDGKFVMFYKMGANGIQVAQADAFTGPYTVTIAPFTSNTFLAPTATWTGQDYIAYIRNERPARMSVWRSKDLNSWENITPSSNIPTSTVQGSFVEVPMAFLDKLREADPNNTTAADAADAAKVPVDPNSIERPAYAKIAKPITRKLSTVTILTVRLTSAGYVGETNKLIATQAPDTQYAKDPASLHLLQPVGKDMADSFSEAARAIALRYPKMLGDLNLSFDDRDIKIGGPSAGMAYALLVLSALEGFEIDPKMSFTGDISVDWKIKAVGGVPQKLRATETSEDHYLYACIPDKNEDLFNDMGLLYGKSAIYSLQVFAVSELQQTIAIARTDRSPQVTEAMKRFAELQTKFKANERQTLADPATKDALKKILELAPNHLSARYLLAVTENKAPRTLTSYTSDEQIWLALVPYLETISKGKIDRETVTPAITIQTRRKIDALRPIVDRSLLPFLVDFSAFIETLDGFVAGRTPLTTVISKVDAMKSRRSIPTDPTEIERRVQQGH